MITNLKPVTTENGNVIGEKALLSSMEHILAGMGVMIYVTNPETHEFLFVNDSLKRNYGMDESCIGQPCYKFLQKGQNAQCEFCPCIQLEKEPDGEVVWEDHNAVTNRVYRKSDRFIDWPGGKKAHLQYAVDITDIKHTQHDLANQNLRLNLLVKGLNVGLWDRFIDRERTYDDGDTDLWWSDEFRNLLGFTDENDFPNKTSSWLNRIHPDDLQPTIDAMTVFLADKTDKTPYNVINRMKLKSGEYRWFRSFGSATRDEEGNPLRTAGATEDITAQKEAELEIAEKSEMNQIMFNNAPVGLTVFDENFKFIDCNDNVLKIYGVTREVYSEHFGSAAHSPEYQPDGSNSREKALSVIKRVMDGETMRIDWLHRRPDGELLPVELTMVRAKQGDRYVGLGYIYDMREQHSLKAKLESALHTAEAANQAKSTFLTNMSHEIRTPMNAILGITEIELRKENLPPEGMEALSRIYESGDLLLNIINDILDLSKIEAGKLEIAQAKYNVPSLINNAVQVNRIRFESKPIEFFLDIDADTPLNLFGDEMRIKQVLNNILSNAYKYTEKGSVRLSVSAEARDVIAAPEPQSPDENDVTLVLQISDTGQGMTEEQIGMLFVEYARFNLDINRTTAGTGLGMSITKRLLELMGGEIYVRSEPGKGSTFTVHIPQKRVDRLACGFDLAKEMRNFRFHDVKMSKRSRIVREHMPDGRVLVVDDVETNIYVAKGMLLPYGLRVDSAASGPAAIEKIKAGNVYDIVFMDHMMPGMDGIEAVKILRGMGYKHCIIALTANAMVGYAEIFLENGFDAYISKPIDTRELDLKLNEFVRNKKSPKAAEAARRERRGKKKRGDEVSSAASNKRDMEKLFALDAAAAIGVLESSPLMSGGGGAVSLMSGGGGAASDADKETYEITVHGMKSALLSIGETELSDFALKLEKAALENNLDLIRAETPAFVDALGALAERMKSGAGAGDVAVGSADDVAAGVGGAAGVGEAGAAVGSDLAEADLEYLRGKLSEVKTACEASDKKTALAIMRGLMQRPWHSNIDDILDEINVHLLHGAFAKAAQTAESWEENL